jgi:A/G-specific adenine glycosylase
VQTLCNNVGGAIFRHIMPKALLAISSEELPRFRRELLAWFESAQRDLDWRRTHDPYRIWLSEIMLQQTRVAAVIPHYRRFVARFPSLRSLARARLNSVLRNWAGLGYYSRARNLHRAAKQIVRQHGGKFPRGPEQALALPGVGQYTAAAVLSIAYGEPLSVLDGNVARVLVRLSATNGAVREPRLWRRLAGAASGLLDAESPGDWNQAMMELGATVCTPRTPRCAECPVAHWCRARALGVADSLPAARRKPKTARVSLAATVLLDPCGHTLVLRDEEGGALFSRLWQFPAVAAGRNPKLAVREHLQHSLGVPATAIEALASARHTVTFREIRLLPFLVRVGRLPALPGARTPLLDELDRLPVSSATRKIAASALRAVRGDRGARSARFASFRAGRAGSKPPDVRLV